MKRKCGTCKYFQDKGVANSGTCQHFKRQALRDVVLVRQSELACRNTWDQDLWEPHPDLLAEEQAAGEVDELIENQPGTRSPETTIFGGSEMVPILSPLGEEPDRVTSIRVPSYSPAEDLGPAPTMLFDEPEQEVIPIRTPALENRIRMEEERKRELEARRREAMDEIEERMRSRPLNESAGRRQTPWSAENLDPASGAGRPLVPLPEEPMGDQQPTEQLPVAEIQRVLQDPSGNQGFSDGHVSVDGNVVGKRPARRELPVIQEIGLPDSDDPIDRAEHLRGIKRVCGTCRDFRQFGDGTRGQCVNPYAFSERRMVQSDQLACRSSLGTWWMPSDDVWLEGADTSHHGRPTPLLDAATRQERPAGRARDTRSW